jgi:hypothetical protein
VQLKNGTGFANSLKEDGAKQSKVTHRQKRGSETTAEDAIKQA